MRTYHAKIPSLQLSQPYKDRQVTLLNSNPISNPDSNPDRKAWNPGMAATCPRSRDLNLACVYGRVIIGSRFARPYYCLPRYRMRILAWERSKRLGTGILLIRRGVIYPRFPSGTCLGEWRKKYLPGRKSPPNMEEACNTSYI